MSLRNVIGAGSVVSATAPKRMVLGEHFTVVYDNVAGTLIFDITNPPPSATEIESYIATYGIPTENISIPIGGPFPYSVLFNDGTNPFAWAGKEGLASWTLNVRVAAVGEDIIGHYSLHEPVQITLAGTIIDLDWSAAEVRDFGEAAGVEGKIDVSVGDVVIPAGFQLRAAYNKFPYVQDNHHLFHSLDNSVEVEEEGVVTLSTGEGPGTIVRVVLLWYSPDVGQWGQASAIVRNITMEGLIDAAFPSIVVVPSITGAVAGKAYIGQQVTGNDGDWNSADSFVYQYLKAGIDIDGATSINYTPVAGDDQGRIRLRVTATNENGDTIAISNVLDVVYAPPITVGSIANITIDQEADAFDTFDWSGNFDGENLSYIVTGHPAVTVDPAGIGRISTHNPIASTLITVKAQNSGGVVQQQFSLVVTAADPIIPWPVNVLAAHWTVTEVTDPAEATAQGFPGVSGRLKAVYSGSLVTGNPTFKVRAMLLAGATPPTPTTALPEVTPGDTYYTPTSLAINATANPRLWREHVASGTFKADAVKAPFIIRGLVTGDTLNVSTVAELQDAMSSVDSGETIAVAAGTYAGTVTKSGVTKVAPFPHIVAANAADRPRFTGTAFDFTNVNGFVFDGLRIERLATTGGFPSGNNMFMRNCDDLTFRNLTVTGGKTQLVSQDGAQRWLVEFCEFGNCGHDAIDIFGGGSNITIKNNRFWGANPPPTEAHMDYIQFLGHSPGSVNNVSITDNYMEGNKQHWHGIFYGFNPGTATGWFTNQTIMRNWFRLGDLNGIRLHGIDNAIVRLNRLQDFPGTSSNNIRIDEGRVTGVVADNVTPRQIVRIGNDQTTGSNNVVSATAVPPGWAGFDVALGRYGPYKQ